MDRNRDFIYIAHHLLQSLSARRAWIEICRKLFSTPTGQVALRKESVDRNSNAMPSQKVFRVALRKESVDRNFNAFGVRYRHIRSLSARRAWIEMYGLPGCVFFFLVALRKESVDRNMWWGVRKAVSSLVALRKESVDRNRVSGWKLTVYPVALRKESVDRNRQSRNSHNINRGVALRKESVDRNTNFCTAICLICRVALRKESVDRNIPRSQLPAT